MLSILRQGAAHVPRSVLHDALVGRQQLAAALGGAVSELMQASTSGRGLPSGIPHQRTPHRYAFSFPGFGSDDLAKKYHEKKLFGYSPHQMFDVVAAVEHYSEFVPWCQKSTVMLRRGEGYLEAELEVGFQIFVERYTSMVTLQRPSLVTSHTGDSTLFSHLNSRWQFTPGPTPESVWLTFEIDFAFKSQLYRQLASLFFEEVVQRMMGAFDGRCRKLYGPSSLLQRGRAVATPLGAAGSGGGGGGGGGSGSPPAASGVR